MAHGVIRSSPVEKVIVYSQNGLRLYNIRPEVNSEQIPKFLATYTRSSSSAEFGLRLWCCTASKLNPCPQLSCTKKILPCSAVPQERCNGFPWRTSYLRQGVPHTWLCCMFRGCSLRLALISGVGICRFSFIVYSKL